MLRLIVTGIVVLVFSTTASATIFISNPLTFTGIPPSSGSYSYDGNIVDQGFTDFNYDASYRITDFHWWSGALTPGSDPKGFRVQIFKDDGSNMPADEVYSEYFERTNVTETLNPGLSTKKYSATLGTSFFSSAGKYWFSVTADVVSPGTWSWAQASTRHGIYDWTGNGRPANQTRSDYAFQVGGVVETPEPASLTLLGVGLLGLAAIRRRLK